MFLHLFSLASHSHFTSLKLAFVTLYFSSSISRRPTGMPSFLHPGLFSIPSALHPPHCQSPAVTAWALGLSFIFYSPSSSWVSFLRPYPSILLKCIGCSLLCPWPNSLHPTTLLLIFPSFFQQHHNFGSCHKLRLDDFPHCSKRNVPVGNFWGKFPSVDLTSLLPQTQHMQFIYFSPDRTHTSSASSYWYWQKHKLKILKATLITCTSSHCTSTHL